MSGEVPAPPPRRPRGPRRRRPVQGATTASGPTPAAQDAPAPASSAAPEEHENRTPEEHEDPTAPEVRDEHEAPGASVPTDEPVVSAAADRPLPDPFRGLRRAARSAWRRLRRPRPLRDRFLSENLRTAAALLGALVATVAAMIAVPPLRLVGEGPREQQIAALLMLLIVAVSLYSLLFTGLTLWSLQHQGRTRLVAVARLSRARRGVRLYSALLGRTDALSEAMQLVVTAGIAILLLTTRPDGVPLQFLLALTVASIITAWIGAVVTFALAYVAEDAHGTAFALPGTPGPERGLEEYVYAAVLIQTSAGASDLAPLTTSARGIVRDQAILSHVTSTILITLAVSAVITTIA